MIDGELYKKVTVACGDPIPEEIPDRTGYTFNGWDNLPAVMPAGNITVTGRFTANSYVLKYVLVFGDKGGTQLFRSSRYTYGSSITPLTSAPSHLGYTFIGWEDIPATMPASNITVLGRYKTNIYKVKYYIDDRMVHQQEVAFGDSIPEYNYYAEDFEIADADWQGTRYQTMPAKDVVYTCPQDIINQLSGLTAKEEEDNGNGNMMYDISGRRVSAMKSKGIYIVNGKKILKQ
jgi:hypothetical protein